MKRPDKYTKTEMAKRLNEPPRKIQFWVDSGLIVPDIVPPSGRGRAVVFSERNLIEFGMIQVLQKCSLTLETIKKIFSLLRKDVHEYDDFFYSPGWGRETELFFTIYQPDNRVTEFWKIDPDQYTSINTWTVFPTIDYGQQTKDCLTMQTIYLGRIKLQAMKNLGLIDDVKFLDFSRFS